LLTHAYKGWLACKHIGLFIEVCSYLKAFYMKHSMLKRVSNCIAVTALMLWGLAGQAQDKIEVDTGEVKSWLEQNWIWVAGGILFLILLVALTRGSRTTRVRGTRRTTTVVKDEGGHTKSVTTTEEKI
jgi:hypothetical protein